MRALLLLLILFVGNSSSPLNKYLFEKTALSFQHNTDDVTYSWVHKGWVHQHYVYMHRQPFQHYLQDMTTTHYTAPASALTKIYNIALDRQLVKVDSYTLRAIKVTN